MSGRATLARDPSKAGLGKTAFEPHARLPRITRETMQDRVYASLREAIMRGEIRPGQNLTLPELAAAFGTSAMPVRQALFRLSAERALTVVAGRSVGVPPLSRSRLRDLTRVRVEIEGLAAAWAAAAASPETIAALEDLVEQMWQHSVADDDTQYLTCNQAFHFAVYRASGSPTLVPIIGNLWLQIGPYLSLLRRSAGKYRAGNEHHAALCRAMRRRDCDKAREVLASDLTTAADFLLTIVTQD